MDLGVVGLVARMVLINVVPFFLVFKMVMLRRNDNTIGVTRELDLISYELRIVGVLGYFSILSIYFFSIPVLHHIHQNPGYEIHLIAPQNTTVFLIAFISYCLVVCSIYMKAFRKWAYGLAVIIVLILFIHSFLSVLEIGFMGIVPILVFGYLMYRLTRPSIKNLFINP